jgi:hypothetical protein
MSILDVDYKRAFPNFQRKREQQKASHFELAGIYGELSSKNGKKPKHRREFDAAA